MQPDQSDAEIRSLRACIRDLVSLSALPAVWSSSAPVAILTALADALIAMLRLDVVYVRTDGTPGAGGHEVIRVRDESLTARRDDLIAFARGLDLSRAVPAFPRADVTSIRFDRAHLGYAEQTGVLLGGSARPGYPNEWDTLLLAFAANQAAIALRGAQLTGARARAERDRAELLVQEQAARAELETIHRTGQVLSAELDLPKLVQAVTDATTDATGAQIGAFVERVITPDHEHYALHTRSGAPPASLADLELPLDIARLGAVFDEQKAIRIDDARHDPRLGHAPLSDNGPPAQLPAMSYLAVPVVSRSGDVLGGLVFGHTGPRHFTERHENIVVGIAAQTAIALDNARLYEETRAAVRARDEFLSIASHELKTPITGLKGNAQLLRRLLDRGDLDDDRLRRLTATMVDSSNRLTALVDDLLDVSRVRSGQLILERAPTDVAAIVRRVAADYADRLDEHHQLAVDIPDRPLVLSVDAGRLEQVVVNLVENAIKYSPAGGTIHVALTVESDSAYLRIADPGIGIAAQALESIFEPFGRAPNAAAQHLPGMGLGLFICRNIVERHGGRIWAESPGEGRGTTTVVVLPLEPLVAAEVDRA